MREASATAVLSKRGVGRPAQHDGDWNSSTKIERRKSLPPPRASTQLLLADAEQAGKRYRRWMRSAIEAWADDRATADDARLINWMLARRLLPNEVDGRESVRRLVASWE